jgi:murein DD-endopeptidase MepM/ murein hydrolase activator NlpD
LKKNKKRIYIYKGIVFVIASLFSFSTVGATTIEIKRNFSKSFDKNSQNILLLDYVGYTSKSSNEYENLSSISYENSVLSAGNSVSIDPLQIKNSKAKINKELRYYRVVSGDSISVIAENFGVSQATIVEENNIIKGRLKINQELVILPVSGIKHLVTKGDTVNALAKEYSAKAGIIIDFNEIPDNALKIGQNIIIPGGKAKKKKIIAKRSVSASQSTGSSQVMLVGDGNVTRYINYKGIVPYGKGAKIAVPKRSSGRSRYTKTNYGYFTHPAPRTVRTQSIHHRNAIDMGGPRGTNIYAAAAGKVIKSYSGGWGGGYGVHLIIEHTNGVQTMYAHNFKNLVSKGDIVTKGQHIAEMGSTGKSTGPHLHFEVRGAYNPF